MNMPILEIENLSKSFGPVRAVDGLCLSVAKGEVFGFLGQNGAGKTTTLRMVTGLSAPNGGHIRICGQEVHAGDGKTNNFLGYLPDVPEFYGWMRPKEYLGLCADLFKLSASEKSARIDETLHLVGLEGINRKIAGFSRGMKQRLGIAQAILHRPQLLILDEPTSALDPVGRKEILDIILALKGQMSVLFSTHILSDVERVSDKVGILRDGKLALEGSVGELTKHAGGRNARLEITEESQRSQLAVALNALAFVQSAVCLDEPGVIRVQCSDAGALNKALCPLLARMELSIARFEWEEHSLEGVFIEVIR